MLDSMNANDVTESATSSSDICPCGSGGVAGKGMCLDCWLKADKVEKHGKRARGHCCDNLTHAYLDPEPCLYPPGTAGKLAALERRAVLGYCLWHPLDAKLGDPLGLDEGEVVLEQEWERLLRSVKPEKVKNGRGARR